MTKPADVVEIERELRLPGATVQIAHFKLHEEREYLLYNENICRVDLSLTPRPEQTRARYRDYWAPEQFERMGALYLLPPGQSLVVKSVPSIATSLACEFCVDTLADWLETEWSWTECEQQASLRVENWNLQSLLHRLADELRHPGFGHETMVELIMAQATLEMRRFWKTVRTPATAGALTMQRLREIDERLAQEGPPPSLSELAALCRLSVRQLMRAFRASRGCTVGDYVARKRVEMAKHRLLDGESIKSISRALSFGTPSSFAYAFRKVTGMSPRQYRNQSSR